MKSFILDIVNFARSGMTGPPNYAPEYIERLIKDKKPMVYLIGVQSLGGFEFRGASLSKSVAESLFETVKTEVLGNYQGHLNWLKEQSDVSKTRMVNSRKEWQKIKKKVSKLTIDNQDINIVHPRPHCKKVYLS